MLGGRETINLTSSVLTGELPQRLELRLLEIWILSWCVNGVDMIYTVKKVTKIGSGAEGNHILL